MPGRASEAKIYPRMIKRRRVIIAIMIMAVIQSAAITAMAAGTASAPPPCVNHTVHDASCGYKAGTETRPCGHRHTEECYLLILDCVHMAGDGRYNGIGADKNSIEHTRDCYVQKLYCAHTHNAACGYVGSPQDAPCSHKCALCGSANAGDPAPVSSSLPAAGQEQREDQEKNQEPREPNEEARVDDIKAIDESASLWVEIAIYDHAGNQRTEPANEPLYIGLFAAGFIKEETIEPRELVWDEQNSAYAPIIFNDLPQGDYYIYELLKKGEEFARAAQPDAEFPYFVSGDDGRLISIKDSGAGVKTAAIKNTERSAWVNIEANKELRPGPGSKAPGEQAYLLKIKREDGKSIKGDIKELTLTLRRAGASSAWSGTDTVLLPAGEYLIYEAESPAAAQRAVNIEGSANGSKMAVNYKNHSVSFNVDYSDLDTHNPPSSTGPLYPNIDVKVVITDIDEADR